MPRAPGRWSTLLIAALGCWACSSTTEPSNGDPPGNTGPASVLVVTHTEGFRHSSIAIAETTIAAIGTQSGLFTTTFCRTADDVTRMLTPGALSGVDAIVFANTTGTLPIPDLAGVLNWIAQGRGFAGMHSASDTFHGSSAYLDMLGNEFQTHGLQTSKDGKFSVEFVECLAGCGMAPVMMCNEDFYEGVTNAKADEIMGGCK